MKTIKVEQLETFIMCVGVTFDAFFFTSAKSARLFVCLYHLLLFTLALFIGSSFSIKLPPARVGQAREID